MRSGMKIISFMMAAAFLSMAIVQSVPAQSLGDEDDKLRACARAIGLDLKLCRREMDVTENRIIMMDGSGQSTQFEEPRISLAQIRADLRFLQAVASYLSSAASPNGELNFKAIAKSAQEIRKRADRLKSSLALPRPGTGAKYPEEEVPADAEQLRAALSTLSSRISDAVRNPVLRGYVLDVTRSAEAGKELNEIAGLSRRIKMSSEMLGKARQ
jgi:hypothetical protein